MGVGVKPVQGVWEAGKQWWGGKGVVRRPVCPGVRVNVSTSCRWGKSPDLFLDFHGVNTSSKGNFKSPVGSHLTHKTLENLTISSP